MSEQELRKEKENSVFFRRVTLLSTSFCLVITDLMFSRFTRCRTHFTGWNYFKKKMSKVLCCQCCCCCCRFYVSFLAVVDRYCCVVVDYVVAIAALVNNVVVIVVFAPVVALRVVAMVSISVLLFLHT